MFRSYAFQLFKKKSFLTNLNRIGLISATKRTLIFVHSGINMFLEGWAPLKPSDLFFIKCLVVSHYHKILMWVFVRVVMDIPLVFTFGC